MERLKSFFFLYRKLRSTGSAIFWKLFHTQVKSMLTYGAEVRDYIEKVHTLIVTRFLNVQLYGSNQNDPEWNWKVSFTDTSTKLNASATDCSWFNYHPTKSIRKPNMLLNLLKAGGVTGRAVLKGSFSKVKLDLFETVRVLRMICLLYLDSKRD